MSDFEIYERRAREAEELAELVTLPLNRQRYHAIAAAWRELMADAKTAEPAPDTRAA
jgi:hypothetical protein